MNEEYLNSKEDSFDSKEFYNHNNNNNNNCDDDNTLFNLDECDSLNSENFFDSDDGQNNAGDEMFPNTDISAINNLPRRNNLSHISMDEIYGNLNSDIREQNFGKTTTCHTLFLETKVPENLTPDIFDFIENDFNNLLEQFIPKLKKNDEKEKIIKNFEFFLKKFEYRGKYMKLIKKCEQENPKTDKFIIHDQQVCPFIYASDTPINIYIYVAKKSAFEDYLICLADYFLDKFSKNNNENKVYIQNYAYEDRPHKKKLIINFKKCNYPIIIRPTTKEKLISTFYNGDERFEKMGTFLTYWAKQRGILEEHFLNSQNLYILLIFFFQIQNPPIFPPFNLLTDKQHESKTNSKFEKSESYLNYTKRNRNKKFYFQKNNFNFDFISYEVNLKNIRENEYKKNELSLGKLLTQFFFVIGYVICETDCFICIREGRFKKEKNSNECGYGILDPFLNNYLITPHLRKNAEPKKGKTAFQIVQDEFVRAYRLISQKDVRILCAEYIPD